MMLFFGVVSFVAAQPEPTLPSTDPYEELPELKASEILRPTIFEGSHHKVREEVTTYSGANRFTIDSHFGVFEAEGNEMLVRRVNEINAIAELKEVSRGEEYKNALLKAAKGPLATAKHIITDPVNTIKHAPKGIMKFMSRAGESLKSIGKKRDEDEPDGSKLQQIIGFTDTKRKVALSLGVDPYSSNTVLQKELDGISWASFAGGATFKLGTMPIGGAAGIALTTTEVSDSLEQILREKSPADLKILNRKSLIAMGASEKEASQFLENSAFSPTAQTAFVLNLKSLDGVENRRAFANLAGRTSSSEADAVFCVQTAALMSKLHKEKKPLARILLIGDFPICIAKDGTVVVALQWDYAAWTPMAEKFGRTLQAQAKPNSSCLVAITGTVSPRLRRELEARHFQVEDRLAPGPLK
jgi:hypothetical protein